MKLHGLAGKRVVVTRAAEQAGELSALLKKEGAIPIEIPTISLVPPDDWAEVDRAISNLNDYQILIFTSQNGVRFFWDRLSHHGIRSLPGAIDVAAIGEKTARALKKAGVVDPLVPEEASAAEELMVMLSGRYTSLQGWKILFPRAETGREILRAGLRRKGAHVDLLTVYRTIPVQESGRRLAELIEGGTVDWITFASGSAVEGFFQLRKNDLSGVRVAAIGRVTARALEKRGVTVSAEPKTATIEAMVEAMKQVG